MANNMKTMQGCCDCATVNPPCECGNEETAVVGTWDNTTEEPCNIASCICEMYIWLFEVELEWRTGVDPVACKIIDGAFVLTPDNTSGTGCERSGGPHMSATSYPGEECCGDQYDTPFNQPGACQLRCPALVVGVTCAENGSGDPVVYWSAQLRDRLLVDVCNDYIWWNASGAGDVVTTITPGMSFDLFDDFIYLTEQPLYVISAKVTLLGKVCGGDLDGDGTPEVPEDVRCNNKCGLTVDFTIEDIGGCRFRITNITDGGECGIKKYIWSDGYVSTLPERPVYRLGGDCGEQTGNSITLWVIDEKDCVYEKTKTLPDCCRCEDEDANNCNEGIGGTLTATLTGEADCEYELCASVPAATALCGDDSTSFIEYQLDGGDCSFPLDDCDCLDVEADLCRPVGCGRSLTDGECDTVTIDRTTQLRWRVWDKPCGCPGPWNYEELPCTVCSCCDGKIAGAMIAVTGVTNCDYSGTPGRSCNCTIVNQTYDVPATTSCGGSRTFTGEITCNDGGGPIPIDWYLEWNIYCDEDGYWLQLGFNISNAPFGDFETVFLGETMPACVDISECVTISNTDTGCGYCDIFDVTLCVTFYA